MSHFSTIQTKIKDRPALLEALELLGYNIDEDVKLENPHDHKHKHCLLYTSPSPRDGLLSRMPSSA